MVPEAPKPKHSYEMQDIVSSEELFYVHTKLAKDLHYFASKTLTLIDKHGKISYVVFNEAQNAIHGACEHMLKETGWVRILIVKGRQQGCSTYVAARYFHKAISVPATRVYILSHDAGSTSVLFGKVATYSEHCPEQIKPSSDIENRTEIEYTNKSKYTVGTAGSKNAGRSDTALLHHKSEPAFYEKPEDIKAGMGQTLPDLPGTEDIWESTCNGYNFWRVDVLSAVKKQGIYTVETYRDAQNVRRTRLIYQRNGDEGMYRAIFIPWHITKEYRLPVPKSFEITEEEQLLKEVYDLDDEQLVWRRNKIEYFKSESKFKQEYPFTLDEAFQHSGTSHINANKLKRAMANKRVAKYGANILGVDGSSGTVGGDRAVISKRRGKQFVWKKVYYNKSQDAMAAIVANIINDPNEAIDKVFVDMAYGDRIVEALRDRDFDRDIVEGVYFGSGPTDEQYLNKRAEMLDQVAQWVHDDTELASIPNEADIEVDFMMLPEIVDTSSGKRKFPLKREIKDKNGGLSPDILDSFALTFAYEVRGKNRDSLIPERDRKIDRMPPKSEFGTRERMNRGSGRSSISNRRNR